MLSSLKRFINLRRKPLIYESEEDGFPIVVSVSREENQSQHLLDLIAKNLSSLWDVFFITLNSGFEDYGHAEEFPPSFFFLNVGRMTSDVYMGDESSYHIRFEFEREKFSDTIGFYDFFLDEDLKVVHHQPVF